MGFSGSQRKTHTFWILLVMTNSLLLIMAIELVSFPMNSMVDLSSSLGKCWPEGTWIPQKTGDFVPQRSTKRLSELVPWRFNWVERGEVTSSWTIFGTSLDQQFWCEHRQNGVENKNWVCISNVGTGKKRQHNQFDLSQAKWNCWISCFLENAFTLF